jgi:hypothetical protein
VGKISGDCSGSRKPVRSFCIEIKGNLIPFFTNFHLKNSFHRTNCVRKSRDECVPKSFLKIDETKKDVIRIDATSPDFPDCGSILLVKSIPPISALFA